MEPQAQKLIQRVREHARFGINPPLIQPIYLHGEVNQGDAFMSKDLRGLLEPGLGYDPENKVARQVPLAHRRSLASPGQPRVYRVQAGYLCGLCGRIHSELEIAFDCLGRCTIELRLRAPATPSLAGRSSHFACAACGKGFANASDAEQCFEGCLGRIRPTPLFHHALRRIQSRYIQRLKSHGLRALERIDALSEHSKMLAALSKGQAALASARQHLSALLTREHPAPALPQDVPTVSAPSEKLSADSHPVAAHKAPPLSSPNAEKTIDLRESLEPNANPMPSPVSEPVISAAPAATAAPAEASSETSMLLEIMKENPEVANTVSEITEEELSTKAGEEVSAALEPADESLPSALSEEDAEASETSDTSNGTAAASIDSLDLDGMEVADGKTAAQLQTERKEAFADLALTDKPSQSDSLLAAEQDELGNVFHEASNFASALPAAGQESKGASQKSQSDSVLDSLLNAPPMQQSGAMQTSSSSGFGTEFDDLLGDDILETASTISKPNKVKPQPPRSSAAEVNDEDSKLLALLDGSPNKSAA